MTFRFPCKILGNKIDDEYFNWVESETGEAIEQGQDGYWYYNELKDNKLQKSSIRYSKKQPKKGQLKSDDVYRWKKGLPLTGKDYTSTSHTEQKTELNKKHW